MSWRASVVALAVLTIGVSSIGLPAAASSMVVATGDGTSDGRPVLWKNRDHWSTPDGWQVYPYAYQPDGSTFGTGDRYGSRFSYTGVTAKGESGIDVVSGEVVPWAGSNDRGLGVVQVAGHTVTSQFQLDHGFPATQDLVNGMSGGYLNHLALSRAETVDEVEQILRDTNNGGGFHGSTARNTSSMISVFDRWGNAAVFEMDGDSFTRDNVTAKNTTKSVHLDDKDTQNPANGDYRGWDWRNNFSKVQTTKPSGFPYYVDNQETTVDANGDVINSGMTADGIHDWETSPSSVNRFTRTAARMDDPIAKDYRYFIQKTVPTGGVPGKGTIETVSRSIGDLTGTGQKETGYHVNRFVSTFGFVTQGSKVGDPYDGKLTTIWVALGEPSVSVYVPLFPWAGSTPTQLTDMYLATNAKRHLVYDYTDDNACGYSCGRNIDHSINLDTLVGSTGYYGEGGVQGKTFALENWAFGQYDAFIAQARSGQCSVAELRTQMIAFQNAMASQIRTHYEAGTVPTS